MEKTYQEYLKGVQAHETEAAGGFKRAKASLRNDLIQAGLPPEGNPPGGVTGDLSSSSGVVRRDGSYMDPEVLRSLLERGHERKMQFSKPWFQDKNFGTPTENYIRQNESMLNGITGDIDKYLGDKTNRTLYDENGNRTTAGDDLQTLRDDIDYAFRQGTSSYIRQRSKAISESIQKSMSQTQDVDKIAESALQFDKLAEDHSKLAGLYQRTRANPNELTPKEAAQLHALEGRDVVVQRMAQTGRERVFSDYETSLKADTRQIDRLLARQQNQTFQEGQRRINPRSIFGFSLFDEQMQRQENLDTLQLRQTDKQKRLADLIESQRQWENRENISSDFYDPSKKEWISQDTDAGKKAQADYEASRAAKLQALGIAIAATTEQANLLGQAVTNAQQALSKVEGAEGFQMLGQSIDQAREKLRQLSQGVRSDSGLQAILAVQDTARAAEKSVYQMRDQSKYYKNGEWDTSTPEGVAARDRYKEALSKVQGMYSDSEANYAVIHDHVQREQDMFMRSYGVRHASPVAQLEQWYQDQEWRGSERQRQL